MPSKSMSPKRKAKIEQLPKVEQHCATSFEEALELSFCNDWKSFCEMRAKAMHDFWLSRIATPPGLMATGDRTTSREKKLKKLERIRAKLLALDQEMDGVVKS